ncbi:MAG TPA: DUF262 domain-containing protein [Candidatus Acidoferrales bacterium]|nr:DUF262 domain-containing protein [Candidatus Acidoferrales bacterium]
MRRRVEDWTIEKVHKSRPRMSFPEYQREPNLWSIEKRRLLIDSILRDIDIPKLYFNKTSDKGIEVVDGSQRLWSIWEFIDDAYAYTSDGKSRKFSELPDAQQDTIRNYELQITIFEDASDEYLRELFVRLQLGLLLVTGEKLHAASGAMKDFVFGKFATHRLVRSLNVPKRRYAKETLGAQVSINSFSRAKVQAFSRTRYEDLEFFFKEYEHPQGEDLQFFRDQSKRILTALDGLWECFGERAHGLSNRSYILSIYLLFEKLGDDLNSQKDKKTFVDFVFALWTRLRQEISAGIDRKNRELYAFETMLSSAPGERYQIERRHQKLIEYYEHFKRNGKILGD